MAVDEAILERYANFPGRLAPTLRLYGWSPPALSLGRGQKAPDGEGRGFLLENGVDLVRRPSGGGGVLHDAERTYAVIGRLRSGPFPGGVLDTYRRVSEALGLALRRLGIDVSPADGPSRTRPAMTACFDIASPYELIWRGKKLVGSAQLRRRHGFLQHGALPARSQAARVARALGRVVRADRHGGLEEALGRRFARADLDRVLVDAFAEVFETSLIAGRLEAEEIEHATRLRAFKYLSWSWTVRGRVGARELRWGSASGSPRSPSR